MPDATNSRRQYFRYTDNQGGHWAVKVDRNWGAGADNGFVAYGGGGPAFGSDPILERHGRFRPRTAVYFNQTTKTTNRRVFGSATAAALTSQADLTYGYMGIAGAATGVFQFLTPERIPRAHDVPLAAEAVSV
jgi:hypothetical protein